MPTCCIKLVLGEFKTERIEFDRTLRMQAMAPFAEARLLTKAKANQQRQAKTVKLMKQEQKPVMCLGDASELQTTCLYPDLLLYVHAPICHCFLPTNCTSARRQCNRANLDVFLLTVLEGRFSSRHRPLDGCVISNILLREPSLHSWRPTAF